MSQRRFESVAMPNVPKHLQQLFVVTLFGLAARLAVFRDVAVNGDSGLYLYDAKQLLWGRQIFIDFPSRSPIFEWALAAVVAVSDSPLVAGRSLMVSISVLLGIAVYVLACEVHSQRAGLAAAALFLLTPFSIVWGTWIKTEQAAALVTVLAFALALRHIDRERVGYAVPASIGVLFAVAWQIRRVAIVHIGAFCLFVLWYRWSQMDDIRGTIRQATVVVAFSCAASTLIYLLVADGDLETAWNIFETHALALFLTDGQGSIGWTQLVNTQAVTAASGGGLLAQLCQKCGANTLAVVHRTALVSLPLSVPLLVLVRSYTRREMPFWGDKAIPAMLGTLGLYATIQALRVGPLPRVFMGLAILGGVAAVWLAPPVPWRRLWRPKLALPIVVLVALAAGYLHRDRIIYVTYFQDFYPFLAVVAGVALAEYLTVVSQSTWTPGTLNRVQYRRLLTAVLLVTAVGAGATATGAAYPYQPAGIPADSAWHSINLDQQYGDDIADRTTEDAKILTAQPLYVVEADRKIAANLSRKFYAFQGWPRAAQTNETAGRVAAAIRSGEVPYAAIDNQAAYLFENETVREAFVNNYCRIDAPLYNETNGALYEYRPNATDCQRYEYTAPER